MDLRHVKFSIRAQPVSPLADYIGSFRALEVFALTLSSNIGCMSFDGHTQREWSVIW